MNSVSGKSKNLDFFHFFIRTTKLYFSNKREVWRVKLAVAKVRKVARTLLTLEEKDPKRLFEGNALLRRLVRIGVLPEDQMKLDYVLGLKIENFLERRLQTQGTDSSMFFSQFYSVYVIRDGCQNSQKWLWQR